MRILMRKVVIENFLKENNMTKTEFCKRSTLSFNTFNKIFKGERICPESYHKIHNIIKLKEITKYFVE